MKNLGNLVEHFNEFLIKLQESEVAVKVCAPGQHLSSSGNCVLCPIGFYQDREGQTSCKSCPPNTKTLSIGAMAISSCCKLIIIIYSRLATDWVLEV